VAFTLDYGFLVGYLLALARTVAWLMVVPPFSNRQTIPRVATVATAAGLSLLVGPLIPTSQLPTDTAGLVASLVIQVVTGAGMGFVISMLLSAISSAGGFVDLMGGLNLPPSIDPLSLDQVPMLGQVYEQVGVVLLFASGGYLIMIDGFARSFTAPGFDLASMSALAKTIVVDFATYFLSAIEIVAPLLVVLFATQIVLALLAKAAPQVNVWLLGMPLQVFLSLILVALGLSVVPDMLNNLVTRAVGDAAGILGAR